MFFHLTHSSSVRHWGYLSDQNTKFLSLWAALFQVLLDQWTVGDQPIALYPASAQAPSLSPPVAYLFSVDRFFL